MSHLLSRQEAIEQGLPRYFTGQPCKRGHVSERYTMNAGCVECEDEKRRENRDRYQAAKESANGR